MNRMHIGGIGLAFALLGSGVLAAAPVYYEDIVDRPDPREAKGHVSRAPVVSVPPAHFVAHGTNKSRSLKGWGARRA